jgi:hypothetical protein
VLEGSSSYTMANGMTGFRLKGLTGGGTLIWFCDSGFSGSKDASAQTINPAKIDPTTKKPVSKSPYGGGATELKKSVYNSALIANIVAWVAMGKPE